MAESHGGGAGLYRKRIAPSLATNPDDIVSKNVLAQLRRDPPPRPPAGHDAPKAKNGEVEASDLISSMAKRLAALERDMKERQALVQQVQADNSALRSKLKVAEEEIAKRALAAIDPRDDSAAVMHLRSENARLRSQLRNAWKQVADIKNFLADYGMVWVGEPEAEAELATYNFPSQPPSQRNSLSGGPPAQVGPGAAKAQSHANGGAAGAAGGGAGSGAGAGPSTSSGGVPGLSGGSQSHHNLRPLPPPDAADPAAPRRRSFTGGAGGAGPSGIAPLAPPIPTAAASTSTSNAASPSGAAAAASGSGSGAHGPAGKPPMAPVAGSGDARPKSHGAGAAAPPPVGSAAATKPTSSSAESIPKPLAPLRAPPAGSSSSSSSSVPPSLPTSTPLPPVGASAPASSSAARPPMPVSLSALKAKVDELNDLAGDGCGQIVSDGAGQHVLATPDAVNLVVYRDGLQLHTLPAKPYNDPAVNAVLRDIMDGYFPYLLKRDFPDGVPLRVVDRTTDSIDSSPSRRGAAGAAGGGGGAMRPGNVRTFGDIETSGVSDPSAAQTREAFLSRLPQAVIKNGKVIEVRSDIGKLLGAPGAGSGSGAGVPGERSKVDVSLVHTPVDALLSTVQRNHVGPVLPPPSRDGQAAVDEVTTLQVKGTDGKQTYILKMKYDDTIGALRRCINTHLHKSGGPIPDKYEIRSAFPPRAYTEEAETLRAAGLIPNGTLFLRALA